MVGQRTLKIGEQKVNGKPRVVVKDESGKMIRTFKNQAEALNFIMSSSRIGKVLK